MLEAFNHLQSCRSPRHANQAHAVRKPWTPLSRYVWSSALANGLSLKLPWYQQDGKSGEALFVGWQLCGIMTAYRLFKEEWELV